MRKQIICVLAVILIVSIQNNTAAQKIRLLKKTHLPDYPSASSLEFYKDKLYVIGDDAPSILVLNSEYQILDSIPLFRSEEKRIAPAIKVDLESSTILSIENKVYLVGFSSFSTTVRNKIIFVDLSDKKNSFKTVETNLKKTGVEELNIEGATAYNDKILLSNRANLTHKYNSLIVTSINFETGFSNENNKVINLLLPATKSIIGISGITYLKEKDLLLFTASTEETPNAYTDGKIGGSYIGYVKNISKKLQQQSIKVDKLVPIAKYLKEKSAQKIESVAVEKMERNKVIIHLAADNDNGESSLFKLALRL